jgi:hypothetical protein
MGSIAVRHHEDVPDVMDNVEETAKRAYRAFNKVLVTTETILKGWKTACPPLEELYEWTYNHTLKQQTKASKNTYLS